MVGLAFASLRARKGAALGGFVALFFAAAMVCACGVLLETGLRGTVAPGRYAGTPVVVTADQQIHWTDIEHKTDGIKQKVKSKDLAERVWLPTSVGARLRTIRGATVVADRTFTAQLFEPHRAFVAGGAVATYGHNWSAARLTPYRIVAGRPPRRNSDVVLDAGLAARAHAHVGDRIGVQSTRSPQLYIVRGIVRPRSPVTQESAVFFTDAEAETLARRPGSVSAYGVFGAGASAVRAAVHGTGATVLTGASRADAALPGIATARTRLVSMSGAIGGTALIVSVLVVVGTFTLSIQQRYREFALLRAIGATPRQVRRLVNREALALGVLAGLSGALAGLPVAKLIHHEFVSHRAVPAAIGLVHGPFPVVAGVLVTLLASLVASRVSARRVTHIRPAQALAEATVEPGTVARARTVAGLVVAAGAACISVLLTRLHTQAAALPVAYLCVLLWTIAMALFGPFLARGGAAVFAIAWRRVTVGAFLATRNVQTYSRRMASVITPLALLIAMTSTILFLPTTVDAAVQAQTRSGLSADWVLGSSGPGVPASAVARVRSTPGVVAAVSAVESTVWIGRDKRSAQGLGGARLADVIDPDVSTGSLRHFGDHDIAMSTTAAQGRRVGDTVHVVLGDGTRAALTLVAIYRRGLGFGDTLLGFDRLVAHVDTPLAQQVFIAGSVEPSGLRAVLAGYPGVQIVDRSGYRQLLADRQDANDAANLVFLAMILAFCGVAVLNTLAMATSARSREFSLLRLVGATVRQVRGMLRWELAVIAGMAVVLAAGASWATLTGFSLGIAGEFAPTVEPLAYVAVVAAGVVLGALALFVPARSLLRRNPAAEMTSQR